MPYFLFQYYYQLYCFIFTNINIEAYVGVLISIFIIKAGLEIFMDAVNEILGKRVDKDIKSK